MEYQDPYDKAQLLLRYLRHETTPTEQQAVEEWLNENEENRAFFNQLQSEEGLIAETKFFSQTEKEQAWHQLQKAIRPKTRTLWWPRIAAAASIVLALSAGGYFLLRKQQPAQQTARLFKNDIAPGHNQATLTLANGKKIVLTTGLTGILAKQGQTQINVSQNNIIYNAKNQTGDQISYNTLSTARGEQSPYPLVLADGTKVWLNAESSITFPTAFNQKERIVKITGEALFEVAHNPKQPFKVQAANQTIEDIGTQFDVNAYINEPNTRTTLIEGSVKINEILLKPGEQYDGKKITAVNTAQVVAWKDGKFRFIDDNIQTVMRQLSRWYNIDVYYTGTANSEGFNAKISRNQNISVILSALERTNGVHFKIEGRRVTVIQ